MIVGTRAKRRLRRMRQREILPLFALLATAPLALLIYEFYGLIGALASGFALPFLFLLRFPAGAGGRSAERADVITGLPGREDAAAWIDDRLAEDADGQRVAVLAITVDRLDVHTDRLGVEARRVILSDIALRLRRALRESDFIARGEAAEFLLCIRRVRAPQTETLMRLARRLQADVNAPVEIKGEPVFTTISIGIANARALASRDGDKLIQAAEDAGEVARGRGAGAVVMSGDRFGLGPVSDIELVAELGRALETGEITAWYQPQVSTETGDITGFEALARWEHPTRGLISPASFLPLVDQAGLSPRLADVILTHALSAIRTWDRADLGIPCVGVNFAADELRNPHLPEFLRWEIDRFDLSPSRLTVEVLESVIAESHEDTVAKNLRAISAMGCRIDLDDFGTGFTSIMNIRRFAVTRIKIDRQLVAGVDRDQNQRDMVAALLSMSEHLHVETLGEGVESAQEHETLAQLGCQHVQGFAIARPMPLGDTLAWIADHRASLAATRNIVAQTAEGRARKT